MQHAEELKEAGLALGFWLGLLRLCSILGRPCLSQAPLFPPPPSVSTRLLGMG